MQRPVSSDLVVIAGIRLEGAAQGDFTHDHNVVEALAPDRSDEPFNMAILPRRAWRGRVVPDPHGLQAATDDCPVRPVAIPKEIARSLIPGECLGDLARDPVRGWVRGDVDCSRMDTGSCRAHENPTRPAPAEALRIRRGPSCGPHLGSAVMSYRADGEAPVASEPTWAS